MEASSVKVVLNSFLVKNEILSLFVILSEAKDLFLSMNNLKDEAMKQFYVYLMTNKSKTLYTGITNNLQRRVYEHKCKLIKGFTFKYNITRLVYYEATTDVRIAIAREKQIKGWLRKKKIALIESSNPQWQDLSAGWFDSRDPSLRSG